MPSDSIYRVRIQALEAVLYAFLTKYPDGIEITQKLRDSYEYSEFRDRLQVTYNPQRGSYIYSLKLKE